MCLERAWKTELAARAATLILSHQIRGVSGWGMHNSLSRNWTQETSAARKASARYSDFALLRETTRCLVEDHEMRLVQKKKTKATSASSIIETWSPIRIGIALKRPRWWGMDRKTMSSSTFEIAEYTLSSLQMRSGRMSHVLTSSIYCKWDFWSCESDVLKSTHKIVIVSSIKSR